MTFRQDMAALDLRGGQWHCVSSYVFPAVEAFVMQMSPCCGGNNSCKRALYRTENPTFPSMLPQQWPDRMSGGNVMAAKDLSSTHYNCPQLCSNDLIRSYFTT